jgi:hypothetical protein
VRAGNASESRAVRHSLQLGRLLDDAARHLHDDPEAAADLLEAARAKVRSLTTIAVRGERRRARVLELEAALRAVGVEVAAAAEAFRDAMGYSVRVPVKGVLGERDGRGASGGVGPADDAVSSRSPSAFRVVEGGDA